MEKTNTTNTQFLEPKKVSSGGYIALAFAILFFSGLLLGITPLPWLSAFDFTTITGHFGTMKEAAKNTFMGAGGNGARNGFMFAFSLIPGIMFALGILEILTAYGALDAAQRLLSPLLRFIVGLPGFTGLVLITDLQSTDTGAVLSKQLYDTGAITERERIIMVGWQFSAAGTLVNYFSIGPALFSVLAVPLIFPLVIMLIMKFIGANFIRLCLGTIYKGDFVNENS